MQKNFDVYTNTFKNSPYNLSITQIIFSDQIRIVNSYIDKIKEYRSGIQDEVYYKKIGEAFFFDKQDKKRHNLL
ncbi:hypothetical protein HCUR_00379 [Holospora curviuscula]|uniref:Uncharacterized protein n=1 Tax=Holospora curviuscula TaxID=1082868 RepID=A0A2S5RA50_9PROT|nr:hypothetical protein HCUR_00379 [Holospora curviuscula]